MTDFNNHLNKLVVGPFHAVMGEYLKIAFPGKQFTPGDCSPKEPVLSFNDDLLIKQ